MSAPSQQQRDDAASAARSLRTALADPTTMGAKQVMHVDLHRSRRGVWLTTWANLPGFVRTSGGAYMHALLPGWEYARDEIKTELIQDLEALSERGVRPTEATS